MDPEVEGELKQRISEQDVLDKMRHHQGRTPALLYILGLAFGIVGLAGVLGADSWMPPRVRWVIWLCVGILFLYVGALIQERQRLHRKVGELVEAFETFNQTIYGKGYKTQRAAVDMLIQSLDSENSTVVQKVHGQLVRLTGQSLPAEADAWKAWWAENKATWTRES